MSILRTMGHVLARGAVTMLLTGCVLPLSDSEGPSSSYQGSPGAYDTPYSGSGSSAPTRPRVPGPAGLRQLHRELS